MGTISLFSPIKTLSLVTPAGSRVTVPPIPQARPKVDFAWWGERGACIECLPDIEATRKTGWSNLVWTCRACGGGNTHLKVR